MFRPLRVAVTALALGAVAWLWRFLEFAGLSNDHYLHLAYAKQLLLGDLPVRDFTDPGLPLMYILSAAVERIGGSTIGPEWALTATAFAIGAACTVVAAARVSGSIGIATLVTLLVILITPRSYGYPKVLVYAVAACVLLAAATRPSRLRIFALALTVVLSFLLRHDHGFFVGAAAVAALALSTPDRRVSSAVRPIALLAGFVVVLLSPWLVYVTINLGIGEYFYRTSQVSRAEARETLLSELPRFHLEPGRVLFGVAPPAPSIEVRWRPGVDAPARRLLEERYQLSFVRAGDDGMSVYDVRDRSESNLRALSSDPGVADTEGVTALRRSRWREWLAVVSPARLAPALHSSRNADAWLFWQYWALAGVSALVIDVRRRRGFERWPGEQAAIAAVVVMAIPVNLTFLRNALHARLPDAVVPAAILGAWLLGLAWSSAWRPRLALAATRVATIAITGVTLASVAVVGEWPERFERAGLTDGLEATGARVEEVRRLLRRPHREVPPTRFSDALIPFFAYLDRCTTRADRLLLTSPIFEIFDAADRGFAGGSIAFSGGHAPTTRQRESLEILRKQSVPFVVMPLDTVEAFEALSPDVHAFVAARYRPLADIAVDGRRPVRILVDSDRDSNAIDRATGWSCFR